MADLHIALAHYPVIDRTGKIVTSAITSLDLHDLARAARTYGAKAFFVIHPTPDQRAFAARVLEHWRIGHGRQFDSRRREALDLIQIVPAFDDALAAIEAMSGMRPLVAFTSARAEGGLPWSAARAMLQRDDGPPLMVLFGTGFGMAPALAERADLTLPPILGAGDYNHLSVRAAAGIILDRLCGR